MSKGIKRNLLALFAIVLMMGTVLAACGTGSQGETTTPPASESTNTEGNTDAAKEPAAGGKADTQVFRMNISAEPPSLDPAQAQDQTSFTVMVGLYEGLTRMNAAGEAEPAVAESIETSEDGKTWTFKLRQDAKWSNGDPVTAHDFEYSWKRTLDPNLDPPAPYAYQLYYLENAAEYNTPDSGVTADQVGVKALDDYTLEVKLANPTPYFLSLTSFFTYYPVHKATVEGNPAWATEAASFVGNGPFTLAEWKHNDSIKLVKNDSYHNKDQINFTEVHMAMIAESQTELNLYNTGELDWTGGPNGEIPTEQIPVLKNNPEANLIIQGIASTYYYNFNNTKKPFDNVKVRKALSMAINRQLLIDKVTLGNQQPAYGFVSTGIKGLNDEFRKEVDDKQYFQENLEEAKKLWAEGIAEAGWDPAQGFTIAHNTSEGHKRIATAIADMWKSAFGVNVKIEEQEWAIFLQNRTALNYDVARAGWGADYNDPMTFIDMFTSTSGNNDLGFKNAEYDQLVKDAYATQDNAKRMELMAKAEKILIGDNMALAPLYYYTRIWMNKPYVKDVVIDYSGNMDYTRGWIEQH
ncbi:peptide ABC transporter substrate-binding protein [Paenibacillus sp.]|uniref:peptide ABC transporter substrate-binding protein n=1 Tax=Paenibacillus sp. TaxID=58172 RepID=UPI002D58AE44|nr:peptide ABC transporter substrate-binding protein [Paenibacillus sp.]HZG88277.1 peptide ABC transporter substrate-binding protein [Paenibacillus sp.]